MDAAKRKEIAMTRRYNNICWGRGLPSSEKLAEYWFFEVLLYWFFRVSSPKTPPINSLRALRGLSEGLLKQAQNLIF